jgi:hypothetical protein
MYVHIAFTEILKWLFSLTAAGVVVGIVKDLFMKMIDSALGFARAGVQLSR